MSKIENLINGEEPTEFPNDFDEGAVEFELCKAIKDASEQLCYGRMKFLGYISELVDQIYDDKDERNRKHIDFDDLPF
tara:strand:+ start:544 stop:777 length:234 start_codon:yes stop_codon:yes gene_type:complete